MNKIKMLLSTIIVLISSYLLIANLTHMVALNSKFNLSYDDEYYYGITKSYNELSAKVVMFNEFNFEQLYTKEEITSLKKEINLEFSHISGFPFLNKKGEQKFTFRQAYELIYSGNENNIGGNYVKIFDIIDPNNKSNLNKLYNPTKAVTIYGRISVESSVQKAMHYYSVDDFLNSNLVSFEAMANQDTQLLIYQNFAETKLEIAYLDEIISEVYKGRVE